MSERSGRDLVGKVAMVTGAARGIGQAIAIEFASRGANVAICDTEAASDTADRVQASGVQVISERADASDRKQMEQFFGLVQTRFSRVDILVNNAARTVRKPLVNLDVSDVEQTWGATLWAVFHCSQLAARMMIAQDGPGNIVMIGSVLAHIPYVNSSPYNGAKAAVNQMARTWALELAPRGIRVNTVEPGWIDTPGERSFATEQQIREEGSKLPLGRLGKADEIAKAVAFLVSDDASYITGTTLRVDGGITLQTG